MSTDHFTGGVGEGTIQQATYNLGNNTGVWGKHHPEISQMYHWMH